MEGIKWVDIPGFEGLYRISNMGSVMSMGRMVARKGGHLVKSKSKILKGTIQESGYKAYCLRKDGKAYVLGLHRLMMISFVGPIPKGFAVDHIDGDKSNNKLENLEYVSPGENNIRKLEMHDKRKELKVDGVNKDEETGEYRVSINILGRRFDLGYFKERDEADSISKLFSRTAISVLEKQLDLFKFTINLNK